jgi:methyl halide transferase
MEKPLTPDYWNQRYLSHDTPWDIGGISPALLAFFDTLSDLDTKILIPGAGRAYEAVYLHQKGYRQVYVLDWAPEAFVYLLETAPDFPENHLLVQDFFRLNGAFDLMVEQTFFSAIDPALRKDYARQAAHLLQPRGELVGLLFASHFPFQGPPFGGTAEEYRALFSAFFDEVSLQNSPLSIRPRLGNELFIHLKHPIVG